MDAATSLQPGPRTRTCSQGLRTYRAPGEAAGFAVAATRIHMAGGGHHGDTDQRNDHPGQPQRILPHSARRSSWLDPFVRCAASQSTLLLVVFGIVVTIFATTPTRRR